MFILIIIAALKSSACEQQRIFNVSEEAPVGHIIGYFNGTPSDGVKPNFYIIYPDNGETEKVSYSKYLLYPQNNADCFSDDLFASDFEEKFLRILKRYSKKLFLFLILSILFFESDHNTLQSMIFSSLREQFQFVV